MYTKTNFRTV